MDNSKRSYLLAAAVLVSLVFILTAAYFTLIETPYKPPPVPNAPPIVVDKDSLINIILSTSRLPGNIQLGLGDRVIYEHPPDLNIGPLKSREFSLWLVHPFYEPGYFTSADLKILPGRESFTMDLGSLAAGLSSRPLDVKSGPNGYQVGPYPHLGLYKTYVYSWLSENALALHPASFQAGIVDINGLRSYALPDYIKRYTAVLSPDSQKIAFTHQGRLVIRELETGVETEWPLVEEQDQEKTEDIGLEMFSWSPNGRYLIGSWIPSEQKFKVSKLWVLDLQTGKIGNLPGNNNRTYLTPVWSPDGNQVVLAENFAGYNEGYDQQWILVEPGKKSSRVIIARTKVETKPDFTWSSKGQVQVINNLAGPDNSRMMVYDPRRRLYQDEVRADMFMGTELHFIKTNGKEVFRLNLLPSLAEINFPLLKIHNLFLSYHLSPDGRHIYLEGFASGPLDSYRLHGFLDLETRQGGFVDWDEWLSGFPAIPISEEARWKNDMVILSVQPEHNKLKAYDFQEGKIKVLLEGKSVYAAGWTEEGLFYVTPREISVLRPDTSIKNLVEYSPGEKYLPDISYSPRGQYFAVPRERIDTDGLRWITLEIIKIKNNK